MPSPGQDCAEQAQMWQGLPRRSCRFSTIWAVTRKGWPSRLVFSGFPILVFVARDPPHIDVSRHFLALDASDAKRRALDLWETGQRRDIFESADRLGTETELAQHFRDNPP